jgi:hypothetical protein
VSALSTYRAIEPSAYRIGLSVIGLSIIESAYRVIGLSIIDLSIIDLSIYRLIDLSTNRSTDDGSLDAPETRDSR